MPFKKKSGMQLPLFSRGGFPRRGKFSLETSQKGERRRGSQVSRGTTATSGWKIYLGEKRLKKETKEEKGRFLPEGSLKKRGRMTFGKHPRVPLKTESPSCGGGEGSLALYQKKGNLSSCPSISPGKGRTIKGLRFTSVRRNAGPNQSLVLKHVLYGKRKRKEIPLPLDVCYSSRRGRGGGNEVKGEATRFFREG